jgi:hypothetical protein
MRVLVCGGRKYKNRAHLFNVLDQVHADVEASISCIIEGEAHGADLLSAAWASSRSVSLLPYPADWNALGDAAGPIRNTRMLEQGKPDLCVAFPGGEGTADMVRKCRKAGIRVIEA